MYRFKCDGQELRLVANDEAASGFFDTVYAHFELCERWAGMVVVAQYTQEQNGGKVTFNELIDEKTGLAKVSNSLVSGEVKVSIFGVSPVTAGRLTTAPVEIYLKRSGFASTEETPIPPGADLYAQLVALVKNSETAARESAEAAEDSEETAVESAAEAKKSEEAAKTSEENAASSANRAEQTAASAGWLEMEINDAGHLIYTRTETVDAIDFEMTNGRLIVNYG